MADLVSFISAHQRVLVLTAIAVLVWAVFSVPFVVALGRLLRTESPSIAQTATLLSAIGILLLGFGNFAGIGAVMAILSAGTAPSTADRAYQMAIWRNLTFYLTDPGLMTWGRGQLLFAWLGWKSDIIPNWLAIIGVVGGAAGLLTRRCCNWRASLPGDSRLPFFCSAVATGSWWRVCESDKRGAVLSVIACYQQLLPHSPSLGSKPSQIFRHCFE